MKFNDIVSDGFETFFKNLKSWRPDWLYWSALWWMSLAFASSTGLLLVIAFLVLYGGNFATGGILVMMLMLLFASMICLVLMGIHTHKDYSPFYRLPIEEDPAAHVAIGRADLKRNAWLAKCTEVARQEIKHSNPVTQVLMIVDHVISTSEWIRDQFNKARTSRWLRR